MVSGWFRTKPCDSTQNTTEGSSAVCHEPLGDLSFTDVQELGYPLQGGAFDVLAQGLQAIHRNIHLERELKEGSHSKASGSA